MSRAVRSSSFVVAFLMLVGGAALVTLVPACGARGPLDDDGPLDGSAGLADVGAADATSEDAGPPGLDAAPLVDAAPEGGSILGCGTCLFGKCSQGILACVQDAACQKTLQCVVTTCLAGGGTPSPACLFTCASGDLQGALKIFTIFQCVTGQCGADCNALLSGLLGGLGGGGGGGGGGGKDAGKKDAAAGMNMSRSPFGQALVSQWPELGVEPSSSR